jgi:ribosomal protein L27
MLSLLSKGSPGKSLDFLNSYKRYKQTKVQSYSKPDRSFPHSQHYVDKAHIGIRALSSEYIEAARVLVKQRKYISKNPFVTRHRHFKLYPGENVRVMKNTSLVAMVSGRVKFTHDLKRDVMVVNVLPEPREELLADDLWRYRTEHVLDTTHNKKLCSLRQKYLSWFPNSSLQNPPDGPRPLPTKISKDGSEHWNSTTLRDPLSVEPFPFALSGSLLKRHLNKCLHGGDEGFSVTDRLANFYRGKAAQR